MKTEKVGLGVVISLSIVVLSAAGCAKKSPALAPSPAEESSPPPPPPAPPRPAAPPALSEADRFRNASLEELQARLNDVHFDYDRSELREEAKKTLAVSADWLRQDYNTAVIEVEGHADERGTPEYNLGLGERRANAALSYLIASGVPTNRLSYVSYGKERPVCRDSLEDCWWKNRRAHLRIVSR